jgi:uncharacterized protein
VELFLIESKFYTIFSVLFGIGFSILMTRADAKALLFHRFFLRRMAFLLLIGLAHALFFWENDILETYAVCGVSMLPFARARNPTIALASLLAFAAPAVLHAVGGIARGTFIPPPDLLFAYFGSSAETHVAVLAHGGFLDIVRVNAASWFGQVDYVIRSGMIFRIYGCFLLGLLIGRNGIHRELRRYAPAVRRTAIAGLAIGLPLNVVFARTFDSGTWLEVLVATAGVIPLSAGYAAALAWAWMGARERLLVSVFGPVGRMALTNYVAQSAIAMLIFRGVGLGLGGTMGPTLYLPVGLAIYVAQLAFSRAWLSRFQFGPLEWLWRMLTYGARVPLRKPRPAAVIAQ